MERKRDRRIWTRIRPRFSLRPAPGRVRVPCLLATVYCLLATASIAQITFERTYGDTGWEEGISTQQTTDGGYIITGTTGPIVGPFDIYLIKTDSLGNTLWKRTYGGSDNEWSYSVKETSEGGYIISGFTQSFGAGLSDVYLIKTDSLGDTLWTRTYGGGSYDGGRSVEETSDRGYIISGFTQSFGAGMSDAYLIKTDSLGDTLWTRTYGGPLGDAGLSVQETSDGGYIITGSTLSFGAGWYDVYLIKTDSLGDTLWTKTYGGSNRDLGSSVQETQDGGFIIAGYTDSYGAGGWDFYLIKTDVLGDTLWTKTYGNSLDEQGFSVQETSDGGYVITGSKESFGSGLEDVYIIKTDSLGKTLWTRTYGGSSIDESYSIQETSDGGFIITGKTWSFGAGLGDVYLIKTDGNGGVVGVEEESSKLKVQSSRVVLLQNQPNPFSSALGGTVIGYSLSKSVPITLKVYDLTGRLVETLVNKSQEPGVYQVRWEGKDHSSGIYFYRLQARFGQTGDFTTTKKLILLR